MLYNSASAQVLKVKITSLVSDYLVWRELISGSFVGTGFLREDGLLGCLFLSHLNELLVGKLIVDALHELLLVLFRPVEFVLYLKVMLVVFKETHVISAEFVS
jgi:hypothetical protein